MRLLSRVLAGSLADTGGTSRASEQGASTVAPALDAETREFLYRHVNSPVKLDLILYLHDNPYAVDGADVLALRLGREPPVVEECAEELVQAGLLEVVPRRPAFGPTLYRLAARCEWSACIDRLARLHREGGALQIRTAIRDFGIAAHVRAVIADSGRVGVSDVEVRCEAGVVRLEGRVHTAAERTELDLICERLHESRGGIRAVENRVEVERRPREDDEEMRAALEQHLAALISDSGGMAGARVQVDVIGGVAYLTGLVESAQDRAFAGQRALEVPGVTAVVNWIDLQGHRYRIR
ncbi:MAG TPA: BON domain-containing protein [Armatimonadota bacterium]|jgi:osmotically-inducible protein OsmY|nr:BON domain-containing protein [Armatimonadota bacterium]